MKILLIGGTGFVGAHIARNLAALNHEVHVLHRGQTFTELPASVSTIRADIDLLPSLQNFLRDFKFDVILHMTAMTRSDAQKAADAFAGHAGRLVLASSQDVYAAFGALLRKEDRDPSTQPITESSPLRTSRHIHGPGTDYEKIEVEETFAAAAEKLPLTILRMPATFGPNDHRHRFFPYLKRMDDQRPAIILPPDLGNFGWSHAYAENVAHAFTLAITNPAAADRIYNIGESGNKTPTFAERLHDLAAAARYRGKIIVVPRDICPPHLLETIDFRHDIIINDSAIRKELGYTEIVPSDEAFRRTITWQRTLCPFPIDLVDYNYPAEDAVLEAAGLLTPHK